MQRILKFIFLWRHGYCSDNRERWHVAGLMEDRAAYHEWQRRGCDPKTARPWWP